MKVIEGSARGRGGANRGPPRGGGRRLTERLNEGQPAKREGRPNKPRADSRFTGRHSDPRFADRRSQLTEDDTQAETKDSSSRALNGRVKSDPRFRRVSVDSHGRALGKGRAVEAEEEPEVSVEDAAALDEDAAHWSGSDISVTEATPRLAIVNCDWDHVSAEDLFSLLLHHLPVGGRLKYVKVFLSNFGKEQLEHERLHGPNLWVQKGDPDYEATLKENEAFLATRAAMAEANDVEEGEEVDDDDDRDALLMLHPTRRENDEPDGDERELFSSGRYRQYELNRMKYYYAIAEFDSVESARCVYNACDGVDIEASGVTLDLRYVPDSETFEEAPTKLVTQLPKNFKPAKGFKAAALSQTRFQISWDQDDFARRQRVQDAFVGANEDDDLAAYIASSDSEGEDGETKDAIRAKYAALLSGLETEGPMPESDDAEGSSAGEDDDNLNRFSDVELDEDEVDNEDEDDEGEGEQLPTGDMEATLDLDQDSKAAKMQSDLKRQMALQDADLGTKKALQHKVRRKEAKREKKESLREQRETEIAEAAARAEETRASLKRVFGDAAEDAGPQKRGRAVHRELAKTARKKEKLQRTELKRNRLLRAQGVEPSTVASRVEQTQPMGQQPVVVDPRFDSRLVSDPRFHIDLATRGRGGGKQDKALVDAASAVAVARRGAPKRPREQASAPEASTGGSEVDYFLARSADAKRPRRG